MADMVDEIRRSLLWRKQEFEKYFRQHNPPPNSRAHYAYLATLRLLLELEGPAPERQQDPYELRRRAERILEDEYGIIRN